MIRILIVDDTRAVHAYAKTLLSKYSVSVESVMNGAEAVSILGLKKFDVILLDWEMPVLNGPETLKVLKKMDYRTPVIMMTTKNSPDDIRMMLELGAVEYLMKPYTQDILIDKLEQILGREVNRAA